MIRPTSPFSMAQNPTTQTAHPSTAQTAHPSTTQPNLSEGAWDKHAPQRWEEKLTGVAHRLCETARKEGDCLEVMTRSFPRLVEHIHTLQRHSKAMSLWGKSQNWDENAKQQIVEPAILEALGRLAGIEMRGTALHAGLLHTYGYLFSLLETPFGYKRDRWLHDGMGERFDLPSDTFSPLPQAGSLLLNLTYFLGSIVFPARTVQARMLQALRGHLSPALARYPFGRLSRWRITETLSLNALRKDLPATLRIHTDLVFPPNAGSGAQQLLLYSLEAQTYRPLLITAFFTSPNYVETLLRQPQGQQVEVSLRYNAFFDGLSSTPDFGVRAIRPM
jgi:hypothetical protein